ncbi:sensor histidine kinase [Flagellimonas pelagia]|uniref:7TM diverse intracellular signalling n=1 Tax=Flagellimonas pelagia TaxID=2306998 RepID=A0A3A1NHP3_9FLAO|nr:histidine kinase [Allomuricauda maritima]RIV44931.1 hypothetical protein D2V05_08190 [Allomuricauda maritima]TXJ95841.1 hypothetical protein FQ017_08120 [Allomuricauda maritima]
MFIPQKTRVLKAPSSLLQKDTIRFWILPLLIFFQFTQTYSHDPYSGRKTKKPPYYFFKAKDPALEINDILEKDSLFKPSKLFKIDDLDAHYWIKIDFINELDTLETKGEWKLMTINISNATIYYSIDNKIQQKPYGQRWIEPEKATSIWYYQGFNFKKSNLINNRYLYLKVRYIGGDNMAPGIGYLSIPASSLYTKYYAQYDLDWITYDHIYIGACLIIFVTFLLIYLSTRRHEFLFYSLYVIFSLIYLTDINLGPNLFHSVYFSPLGLWTTISSQIFINLFYILFAKYYLDTKKNYPKLDAIIFYLKYLLILMIVIDLYAFFSEHYNMKRFCLSFQRLVMIAFGLFSMIYLLFKSKDKLAIFLVVGSFIFMTGALGFLFTRDRHYMMIGSILEIIIFFLGLAYKIKLEYETRLTLQQEVSSKEISALRAQMNPHFIFNSLSSIQNLILKNDRVSALKYLSQFGKLVRNVLESSNQAIVTLTEEIALLKSYLELESLRFDNAFKYTIDVDENLDADSLEIPLMLIQPFVENAIIHGLVGKKEGEKKLSLSFKKDGQFAVFEIEDNGIGRIASGAFGDPSKKQRKSRGMEITEKRLKMLNKSNTNPNIVEIVDKYDPYGNSTGTKVIIRIFNP